MDTKAQRVRWTARDVCKWQTLRMTQRHRADLLLRNRRPQRRRHTRRGRRSCSPIRSSRRRMRRARPTAEPTGAGPASAIDLRDCRHRRRCARCANTHSRQSSEPGRRSAAAIPAGDRGPGSGADPAGSGRLEFAARIASAENPLTARVMVNRIWKHHFGYGLVRSTDNFGDR